MLFDCFTVLVLDGIFIYFWPCNEALPGCFVQFKLINFPFLHLHVGFLGLWSVCLLFFSGLIFFFFCFNSTHRPQKKKAKMADQPSKKVKMDASPKRWLNSFN